MWLREATWERYGVIFQCPVVSAAVKVCLRLSKGQLRALSSQSLCCKSSMVSFSKFSLVEFKNQGKFLATQGLSF